ncbi:hypothetical protein [Enterococcus sp. CWB-B31]|nr:hypothetical protein [Enterococcus sp. CWB-B31]MCB5954607.1 hypothetical protein [Enterococcus sp. CWB-B31]
MKDIDKELIQALCRNNIKKAKEIAKEKLVTDKAQKDVHFCNQMIDL